MAGTGQSWGRADLEKAQRLFDKLIKHVEGVAVGLITEDFCFLWDAASDLVRLLKAHGTPLNDKLCYFRDYIATCIEDFPGERTGNFYRPLSELGIPAYEQDCGSFTLSPFLVRGWLAHMREFRAEIEAIRPRVRRNALKKGGRRKRPATLKFEDDVQRVLHEELESLRKNGLPHGEATKRLQKFTWKEIVCRINESSSNNYSVNEAIRKRVERAPAWRACRSTRPGAWDSHIPSQSLAESERPRGIVCAAEEGLVESTRAHQRTKLGHR